MRNSKRVKIVAGGTAVLFGAGVAFAAWTSTGTGDGTVDSISDAGLTVAGDDVGGLYPTGSEIITVTVTNDNPYKVALNSITVDSIVSNNPDCNVTGVVTAPDNTAPATTLDAAGGAADSADFPFEVSMSNAANDDCQNNTFTVSFTANGSSAE